MRSKSLLFISVSIAIAFSSVGACAAELVTNGGFETGDFTGFTVKDNNPFYTYVSDDGDAYEGSYQADLGSIGSPATITQTLATVVGEAYNISFALRNDDGSGGPSSFSANFGGDSLVSLVNSPAFGLKVFNFTEVASSSSTVLSFAAQNDPNYFTLDAISVKNAITANSGVPEPESWALMILGFGMVGAAMRVRSIRTTFA